MRKSLQVLILLFTFLSQAQAQDFWHDSVRACVVGGGVIGTASALMIYSVATTATAGATAIVLPAGPVVIGNTIFGCGLGTIGTMIIYGLGSLYQNMVFPQGTFQQIVSPAPAQETVEQPQVTEQQK